MINDDIIEKIDTLVNELNQMKADYKSRLSAKEKEIEEEIDNSYLTWNKKSLKRK